MSRRSSFLLLTILVVGIAFGQWSEPVALPFRLGMERHCFIRAPGDTFWVVFVQGGVSDSFAAYASWSLGDTWSEPESIGESRFACAAGGCGDCRGRLWFFWYDGIIPPFGGFGPCCVMASVREAHGWRFLGSVLLSPGPGLQWTRGLAPAADRSGQVYVGIGEFVFAGSSWCHSAKFARMQGDSLTWPRFIVKGDTAPNEKLAWGLTMVPRPDSGLWSVSTVSDYAHRIRVELHHVCGDTAVHLLGFPGNAMAAVGDSNERLWIFYFTSDDEIRAARIDPEGGAQYSVVSSETPPGGFTACVDSAGWVWCMWPRAESVLVASYNRGQGWSTPETVVAQRRGLSWILADSRGRLHAFYESTLTGWYWTYRMSRPGVAEGERAYRSSCPGPSVVRGVLYHPDRATAMLLDPSGRAVQELRPGVNDVRHVAPGVYFVREEGPRIQGSQGSSVRKIVVQR